MKIVNLKEFLYLPEGTVFAKFSPVFFGELCIKGQNSGDRDFCYQRLLEVEGNNGGEIDLVLMYRSEDGESFNLDLDCQGGDGLYNPDQLFAVYERKDLGQLIKALYVAYGRCGFIDDAWADVDKAIANLNLDS